MISCWLLSMHTSCAMPVAFNILFCIIKFTWKLRRWRVLGVQISRWQKQHFSPARRGLFASPSGGAINGVHIGTFGLSPGLRRVQMQRHLSLHHYSFRSLNYFNSVPRILQIPPLYRFVSSFRYLQMSYICSQDH
jgi:hypothetical protein